MHVRNRSQKMALLRSVPMFAPLSRRHLEQVARHTDEVHRAAGTHLVREGEHGHEVFIVAQGRASVHRHGKTIATLGPGDFIGELSLLDGKPHSATVIADEPVVMLVVGVRELKPLLETIPHLSQVLLKSLAGRLREADAALD